MENDDRDLRQEKRFEVVIEARKLEIELFGRRSLFFWGFMASAFVGYATLYKIGSGLSLIIACFGLVCSVAWTLVNRGSKYWQENWEAKVDKVEDNVTGPLFKVALCLWHFGDTWSYLCHHTGTGGLHSSVVSESVQSTDDHHV